MLSGKMKRLLVTSAMLFVVAAITSVAAFGQTAEPVQIAANTVAPIASKPVGEITPSTNRLQARIDAQQQEINKLSALVEKLQAMLEPVASMRPILPNARIGFLPDPAGSPSPSPSPAPPPASSGYTAPRELLPDIGHIGAELGFFVGGATNPYKDNKGFASGGFIDLPFKKVPGGKLSYEIMIGLQRSVTTQQTTSGVNALVNTALNNYLYDAGVLDGLPSVTNYLTTPLPITSTVQERSKVLTVAPFELKYTVIKLGRFRPYVVGGLGAYVWIGSDSNVKTFDANTALGSLATLPVGASTLGATLNAILQGSQIGGLAPTAPELAARGVPHGQGNVMFGGQIGGGAEIRVTPKFSIGFDVRHNAMEGKNAGFNTFAFQQGLHW
jgi:opacity protein-like surface antigen